MVLHRNTKRYNVLLKRSSWIRQAQALLVGRSAPDKALQLSIENRIMMA